MANNGYELLLIPSIDTAKGSSKKLVESIKALDGKYSLKVNLEFNTKQVEKAINELNKKLNTSFSFNGSGNAENIKKNFAQIENSYNNLLSKITNTGKGNLSLIDSQSLAQISEGLQAVDLKSANAKVQIKEFEIAYRALRDEIKRGTPVENNLIDIKSSDADIKTYLASLKGVTEEQIRIQNTSRTTFDSLGNQVRTISASVNEGGDAWRSYKFSISSSGDEIRELDTGLKQANVSTNDLAATAKRMLGYFISASAVIGALKSAVSSMKDIDFELTALSKVSDLDRSGFKQASIEAAEVANQYGRLAKEYIQAQTTFANSGAENYNALAELSLVTQAAGDLTQELASKYLLASDKAFGYGGDIAKLTALLDSQNQVSNRNAISLEFLAEATQAAGNSMKQAGESEATATAILTAMGVATQQTGSIIGNATRTIEMRLQGVKKAFEGLEVDVDGEILNVEELSDAADALHDVGIELIRIENGQEKFATLSEVAVKLREASDQGLISATQMNQIVEALAGKNRAEFLLALINNIDVYNKAMLDYTNSAGSAMREAQTQASSWESSINKLSNTFTVFVNKTVDSNFFKGIIDSAEFLTRSFNDLGTVILLVSTWFVLIKFQNIVAGFKSIGDSVKATGGGIKGFIAVLQNHSRASQYAKANNLTLSESYKALGVSASIAQIAIGALMLAITAGIVVYNNWKQAQEESARAAGETAKAANEQAKSLDALKSQYEDIINSTEDEATKTKNLDTFKKSLIETYGFEKEAIEGVNLERAKSLDLLNQEIWAEKKRAVEAGIAGMGGEYEKSKKAFESPSDIWSGLSMGYSEPNGVSQEAINSLKAYNIEIEKQETLTGELNYVYRVNAQSLEEQKAALEGALTALRTKQDLTQAEENLLAFLQYDYDALTKTYDKWIDAYSEGTNLMAQKTIVDAFEQGKFAAVDSLEAYNQLANELIALAGSSEVLKQAIIDELAVQFPQFNEVIIETADNFDHVGAKIKSTTEQLEELADKIENLNKTFDTAQSSIKAIISAQEMYNEQGEISADVAQNLLSLEAEYLDALIDENGQINLNSEAVAALINDKTAYLQALAAEQVATYAVTSLEKLMSKATEDAGTAAQDATTGISNAASEMLSLAADGVAAAIAVNELDAALDRLAGEKGAEGIDIESWKENVKSYANSLTTILNNAGAGIGDFTGDYSRSGGGSSKETKEYLADLSETIKLEQQLEDIRSKRSNAQTRLDVTSDLAEQIALREQIIDLNKQEQDTLHKINQQRRGSIQTTVDELRAVGFNIKYNIETNELFIENMEHVNEITGKTTEETNELRKTYETMIKSVIDNNKDNISNSELWLKLLKDIRDEYNEIYQVQQQARENAIKLLEHQFEGLDANLDIAGMGANIEQQIGVYNQIISEAYKRINELQESGIVALDPQIMALRDTIFSAQNSIKDLNKRFVDENLRQYDDYISQRNHMSNWMNDTEIDALKRKQAVIEEFHRRGLLEFKDYVAEMNSVTQSLYDAEQKKMEATINAALRILNREKKALESQKDFYEKQKSNYETVVSVVTDLISKQIDALQKENSELDKQLNLQKAIEAVERLRGQKTKHVFAEGVGFEWQADEGAIADAQGALDDLNRQYALEDKIKQLEEYRDLWQSTVDNYEENQNRLLAMELLGQNWEQDILSMRRDNIQAFGQDYTSICNQLNVDIEGSTAFQIEQLNTLIEKYSSAMDDIRYSISEYGETLEFIQEFESANYETRLNMLTSFVDSSINELARLRAAQESLLNSSGITKGANTDGIEYGGGGGGGGYYDSAVNYAQRILDATSWAEVLEFAQKRENKIAGENITDVAPTQEFVDKWKTDSPYSSVNSSINNASSSINNAASAIEKAADSIKTSGGAGSYAGASGGYADGGVVNFTGTAPLHGSSSKPEVVFDANDAAKLYRVVHTTADLGIELKEGANETKQATAKLLGVLEKVDVPKMYGISPGAIDTFSKNAVSNLNVLSPFKQFKDGIMNAISSITNNTNSSSSDNKYEIRIDNLSLPNVKNADELVGELFEMAPSLVLQKQHAR